MYAAPAGTAGNVSPEARQLCEVTRKALDEAIKICAPGVPYNKIGKVLIEELRLAMPGCRSIARLTCYNMFLACRTQ